MSDSMSDWLVPSRPTKKPRPATQSGRTKPTEVTRSTAQLEARIESLLAANAKLRAQLTEAADESSKASTLEKSIPTIVITQDAAALLAMSVAAGSFIVSVLTG